MLTERRKAHKRRPTLILEADSSLSIRYPPHILVQLTIQIHRNQQPMAPVGDNLEILREPPAFWRIRETIGANNDLAELVRVLHLALEARVPLDLVRHRVVVLGQRLEVFGLAFAPVHQTCFIVAEEQLEGLSDGVFADAGPAVEQDDWLVHGHVWGVYMGVCLEAERKGVWCDKGVVRVECGQFDQRAPMK